MQILFLFAKILLSTYLLITPTSTKWVLIFEDDFNQNEIDTSKWDVVDETSCKLLKFLDESFIYNLRVF